MKISAGIHVIKQAARGPIGQNIAVVNQTLSCFWQRHKKKKTATDEPYFCQFAGSQSSAERKPHLTEVFCDIDA